MVLLNVVVAELGEECFEWFIVLGSPSTELGKEILSAPTGSSGAQTSF